MSLQKGRAAEDAVATFLISKGFELLARNLRLGPHEIDLVARAGNLVVLVEVRFRGTHGLVGPFESVSLKKRKAMLAAAARFARTYLPRLEGVERLRIDVAAVNFAPTGPVVEVAEGAVSG